MLLEPVQKLREAKDRQWSLFLKTFGGCWCIIAYPDGAYPAPPDELCTFSSECRRPGALFNHSTYSAGGVWFLPHLERLWYCLPLHSPLPPVMRCEDHGEIPPRPAVPFEPDNLWPVQTVVTLLRNLTGYWLLPGGAFAYTIVFKPAVIVTSKHYLSLFS